MRILLILLLACLYGPDLQAQIKNEPLLVGQQAPLISGVDQFGNQVESSSIVKDKKIILIFYRGNWCPYCRKHLKSLQENLEALTKKGYHVLVVSPEKPEKTEETTKKLKASFSILHDTDNSIMKAYKVAFEVNSENVGKYLSYTQNKVADYNNTNNNILPVPATFVIDKDHKISLVHFDPDYTKRFDLKELLIN